MKLFNSVIRLAMAGLLLWSCQSDSYKIKGYARQFADGQTVTLALDDPPHRVLGKALIQQGHFMFSGTVDTTLLCRIYLPDEPLSGASFFLEPGTITIELHPYPVPTRVSGTELNNAWQQLNDSVQHLGHRLITLAQQSTAQHVPQRRQLALTIDSLHRQLSAVIHDTGQRNRHNALGQYIIQNYKEPEFK